MSSSSCTIAARGPSTCAAGLWTTTSWAGQRPTLSRPTDPEYRAPLPAPDGRAVDKVRYLGPSAANLSYGRLPDGDDVLKYGLWPTPGEANLPFLPTSSF